MAEKLWVEVVFLNGLELEAASYRVGSVRLRSPAHCADFVSHAHFCHQTWRVIGKAIVFIFTGLFWNVTPVMSEALLNILSSVYFFILRVSLIVSRLMAVERQSTQIFLSIWKAQMSPSTVNTSQYGV